MAKATFTANVSSGSSVGFSGVPGKGNYSLAFSQQFGKSFEKSYKKKKNQEDTVIQDPPKDQDPVKEPVKEPVKRINKGKDATTADVEQAVSKGFITPEEATGGEWGKGAALSSTYSKKSAANAAAHGGVNVGKQFTGVRATKANFGNTPKFENGAPNYGSAPDNRSGVGAVNLDNVK